MPRAEARPGVEHEIPDAESVIAVEELGELVRNHRGHQSIRQAAEEAGVSFSTLSRVEAGAQPDLATFLRLCAWLEVRPSRFFRLGVHRPATTLDEVTSHLFADPRLSKDAARRIVAVVQELYGALAQQIDEPRPMAVHLRAAPVMRPGVPERLSALLQTLNAALTEKMGKGAL